MQHKAYSIQYTFKEPSKTLQNRTCNGPRRFIDKVCTCNVPRRLIDKVCTCSVPRRLIHKVCTCSGLPLD